MTMQKAPEHSDPGVERQLRLGYWQARKHMLYYRAVQQYVAVAGYNARTIIDIGSASAEYINWMDWIPERTILDHSIPAPPPGVTAIQSDFYAFNPPKLYDVALCCQVLEHVAEPRLFCNKLKAICKHLIVTVPYKWLGKAPGHINDPVDEEKLFGWMRLTPNASQVIYEPFREGRLISYYNLMDGPRARFEKEFIFAAIAERTSERGKSDSTPTVQDGSPTVLVGMGDASVRAEQRVRPDRADSQDPPATRRPAGLAVRSANAFGNAR